MLLRSLLLMMFLAVLTPELHADPGSRLVLEQIGSESGWTTLSVRDDGLELSQKALPERDLHAILVQQPLEIDPATLAEVVRSVERYEEIVVSANTVDFLKIAEIDSAIYGYQFYQVPLMKNRHLAFEMDAPVVNSDSSLWVLDWRLIQAERPEVDEFVRAQAAQRSNPVYLLPGAGRWTMVKRSDSRWDVGYRLWIDPGGWLPDFIVEYVNRKGLVNLFDDVIRETYRIQARESSL